jgi:hypothetical protein
MIRKEEIITYTSIGILIFLAVGFLFFTKANLEEVIQFSPETISIYFPKNCSESEIKSAWDFIFHESSEGIEIINNTNCTKFYAYKNNSEEFFYLLSASHFSKFISATYLNISEEGLDLLIGDIDEIIPDTFLITFPPEENNDIISFCNLRSINITEDSAFSNLSQRFKIPERDYETPTTTNHGLDKNIFSFINETLNQEDLIHEQIYLAIYEDVYYENYLFISLELPEEIPCIPNWTKVENSCLSNETKLIWFNDTNNCDALTGKPQNIIEDCDYNENGLIGNLSSIKQNRMNNLKIFINSSENLSKFYSSSLPVKIKENQTIRAKFIYNFSKSPLNLRQIKIEKQSSNSNYGYLIINGINASKEVYVDRINSSSNFVCIKNSEVSSIGSLTSLCTGNREYLIKCNNTIQSGFKCNISGNKFHIFGLTNSAVKEMLIDLSPSLTSTDSCTPNWSCTPWSSCINGSQTRVCIDLNDCEDISTKPDETKDCTLTCTPNWTCTYWSSCKDGERERICTDSNNCGTLSGKPSELEECGNVLIWVLVIIVSILIVIVSVLIVYFGRKKTVPQNKNFSQPANYSPQNI